MRRLFTVLLLVGAAGSSDLAAQHSPLPNRPDSLKFAVIGDNGTGEPLQYELARQMVMARGTFPFVVALMVGDNVFGSARADFVKKFERPYAPLLASGVTFRAALGNHDTPDSRYYQPFNMNGLRYYSYAMRNVRFFVLDTNFLDAKQLGWIDTALKESREEWKICYFHHALYSSAGRHGPAVDMRVLLEPVFVRHGVNAVFSGHDHVYERIKPQKGIHYFVAGSGGKLRKGDLRPSTLTAAGFDQDLSFVLVEIAGAEMFFQVISRTGKTVDSGVFQRQNRPPEMTAEPQNRERASGRTNR